MKMTRVLGLTLVILVGLTLSDAEASCSGSGLTWTCTAGTTPAQINTTIASGTDGMTLTFASGSYTWGGGTAINLTGGKGVTLICQTAAACTVSFGGQTIELPNTSTTKLQRISGFTFTHGSGGSDLMTVCYSCSNGAEITISNFRFDHNTLNLGGAETIFHANTATKVYLYGVMDHNTITITTQTAAKLDLGFSEDSTSPLTGRLGSANNFFVEDNTFTALADNTGYVPCLDGWGTPLGIVWRFNTMTTCRIALHGVSHSYGPSNFEVYGNRFDMTHSAFDNGSGYRTIQHQGSGTYGVWGNSFTTNSHNSDTAMFQHYRSGSAHPQPESNFCDGTVAADGNRSPIATYRGYPCKHQVSRDNDGTLRPVFGFLNSWTDNGAKADVVLNGIGDPTDYSGTHLKPNRDFYNAVSASAQSSSSSPFNGTTGIGHGTLANRPTTCTTTSEPADAGRGGTLYWATDQGSWNQSTSNPRGVQQNGADGVLYMCTATNSWSVYYTPYTYPHPLQAGGGGGASAPSAPSNVRILP